MRVVYRAAYEQVFGRQGVYASQKFPSAEALLRNGKISVQQFIEILAKSEFYKECFFYSNSQGRFIELNYKHFVKNLNHENMYLRWAAIFDLGSVGHQQALEAILTAKVPNSLKLLNLKKILEAVLDNQHSQKETSQLIFKAIDDLLFQL